MFIQIAPKVRVFVTEEQIAFLEKYSKLPYFKDKDLDPQELPIAKVLADKSILVRKKLDIGVQYALNRRIRFVNANKK
mgnify:CR=1 FL=1|jgi:hypothetical protein